ncbi:MAG: hypothetical protein KGI45_03165 [Patescibacteria group bacterium]|nr:hypothetical protein [Patescibacteria group bacterium]
MQKPELEAVVTAISGGRGKEYAVTHLTGSSPRPTNLSISDTVTFSLSSWSGKESPKAGQIVRLSGIEKFAKGWRASSASPIPL